MILLLIDLAYTCVKTVGYLGYCGVTGTYRMIYPPPKEDIGEKISKLESELEELKKLHKGNSTS